MTTSSDNHDVEVVAVGVVLMVISTLGIAARFISHKIKGRQYHVDDWLLLWAHVINMSETVMLIWSAKHAGFGHHAETLSKPETVSYGKVFYSASLLQPCLLASAKTSILILLYRIFVTRTFRYTAIFLMAIIGAWWIAISLGAALICSPVKSAWDPDTPGSCGNQYVLDIIAPIPWILTDFVILFAPLPAVVKLQMPSRQKVALIGLLFIGCLTCVISCIRYRQVFFDRKDPTWDSVDLAIWQIVESNITILCVALVASKPVVMLLMPDKLISFAKSYITERTRPAGSSGLSKGIESSESRDASSSEGPSQRDISIRVESHTNFRTKESRIETSRFEEEMAPFEEAPAVPHEWRGLQKTAN